MMGMLCCNKFENKAVIVIDNLVFRATRWTMISLEGP